MNVFHTFLGGDVHSTNMLSIYSVPGIIVDIWATTVIKTDKYLTGAYICWNYHPHSIQKERSTG